MAYFLQILNGVAEAHRQRVAHRDLKPENILYDRSRNQFAVGDFGIAHFDEHLASDDSKTRAGEILANRSYAAPEQVHKGEAVGYPADVFALGRILNEMFTGQIPIGTDHTQIRDVDSSYAHLDDLVKLMMRQDPASRPTIKEVREAVLKGPRVDLVTPATIGRKLSAANDLILPNERERALLAIFDLAMQNDLDKSALRVARELILPQNQESCLWRIFVARLSSGDKVGARAVASELLLPQNVEKAKKMLLQVV